MKYSLLLILVCISCKSYTATEKKQIQKTDKIADSAHQYFTIENRQEFNR